MRKSGPGRTRWVKIEPLEHRWLLSAAPVVLSIERATPTSPNTTSASVSYTVTFSEPVTGVSAAAFQVVTSGGAKASPAIFVTPVSGSVYNVGVFGISGSGTVGLNLIDNGAIRDGSGNPLGTQSASFLPQQTYAAGTYPRSIVATDINGDGKSDLVMADGAGTVAVLLGNGDGTFGAAETYACGTAPYSVAVADVNGDTIPDLIVSNSGGRNVSVLLGNGNGTFQAQRTFGVGQIPDSLTVADVNGDGKADIITANYTDNTVSVLLGNGNGTFQPQQTYATAGLPFAVAGADINGDGKVDLITANRGGSDVSILLGNGNGTFKAQSTFAAASDPSSVVVADVNADGKADLVVAGENSGGNGAAIVLAGNGDGTFRLPQTFGAGAYPQSVAVADVNGDGSPDLVAVNSGDYTVSVLVNNGAGAFSAEQTFSVGSHASAVAIGDFNGDGRLDIATANQAGNSVSVLLNNANGNFTGQTFSVDSPSPLSVTLGGTLPQAVIPGQKSVFSQTVTITNVGNEPFDQSVSEGLYLTSVGNGFDPTAIALPQSASKSLRLAPGGRTKFKVNLSSIPASIPVGSYTLLINLNEPGGITAFAASPQTLTVASAQMTFASSKIITPARARAGKALSATLDLTNGGNVPAVGALPMLVYASADGLMADAQLLGSISRKINLKPRASARIALHPLTAPSTAGSYFLLVRLDPDASFASDTDPDVTLVSATQVAVS